MRQGIFEFLPGQKKSPQKTAIHLEVHPSIETLHHEWVPVQSMMHIMRVRSQILEQGGLHETLSGNNAKINQ